MEDNTGVENLFNTEENTCCARDVSQNGDVLSNFNSMVCVAAGKAEKNCSRQVHSHPTDLFSDCADNCCLYMEDFVSGHSLADVQACEQTELHRSLARNTLLSERDGPVVNLNYFVTDDSENSDSILEIHPSISDDLYDYGLEFLECSDVLTVHDNEIWEEKLRFLLESDDEDDLKLSKDCDGCAYFLSEMPCLFQVSDNTTPMDTTIGLCGHHSKFKGVNVRRDPSTYSQSTLQTEMTLTVGQHREKTTGLKDKENCKVPLAPAALENDYLKMEGKDNGSVQSAAGFSTDKPRSADNAHAVADFSAGDTGAALTNLTSETMTGGNIDTDLVDESSLIPEEGRRNLLEENARHAVSTLTESLRRNLLKLLNPKELCRYVSNIGQSFQTAAEVESSALFPSQEGVLSTQICEETESLQMQAGLCHTEEADKDSRWEQKRTWDLSEQNQVPYENVSPRKQGDSLKTCARNCDRQRIEPETEKEGIFMTCESVGVIHSASEALCTEKTSQAKNANLQAYSQHDAPCDKRESCHQQVFWEQGTGISSNDNKSKNDTPPFPLWDTDSVPDKQECLCAVLSSAKLCDEPGERGQRFDFDSRDSNDTDTLCSISCDASLFEANPQSVLESGEPGCKGEADLAAVHDKLWKLFHEDDSDCQIPFENCGITSLEMRLTDTRVTEMNFLQETCFDHPLPQNLIEQQEPITQPPTRERTEKEDCSVSNILPKTDEAYNSVSRGNVFLTEADGTCLSSSSGNKAETLPVCTSKDVLNREVCLEKKPNQIITDNNGSIRMTVSWEGKLAVNNTFQTRDVESLQVLKSTQSSNLASDNENSASVLDKSHGTSRQLLHTEQNRPLVNKTITKSTDEDDCHFKDCYPARNKLTYFPEGKFVLPSSSSGENTHQFTHGKHTSVNAIHESCEGDLHERRNHSDLNAQNGTNSGSYHLFRNDGCQDVPVVSNAEYSHLMKLPNLIKTPENITCKNLPHNSCQMTELQEKETVFTPSSENPLLTHFCVEVPQYEPSETEKEQRGICIADEQRAETSCSSGVREVSESQPAASPPNMSEQQVFFLDNTFKSHEELKPDSSNNGNVTSASVSTPLPRAVQNEYSNIANDDYRDGSNQMDIQQVTVGETSPFFIPVNQSKGMVHSLSAMGSSGTGSQAQAECTQIVVKVDEKMSKLGTFCKALQDEFHKVPEAHKERANLSENKQEIQRAIEYSPDDAERKFPLHTLISSKAQRQISNNITKQTSPDLTSSSKLTEFDYSIKPTQCHKDGEVMTPETAADGLAGLPPVDSGDNLYFQRQPPYSTTQPYSLALTAYDPFPVSAKRLENQERSKSCQTLPTVAEPEPIKCKQHIARSGNVATGAKKKLPPATLSKKPRLSERGNASKDPSCVKSEANIVYKENKKEQRKLISKKDSKAPKLLQKIQAELFPDCSGNIKLCCQFGDIHGDSTITWTKDSKLLAQLQRNAQDDSPVSLAIAKASNKDQGMYYCCLSNTYGRVTAEFNLTSEVLEHLSNFQNFEGVEEIEFMQLMFREDFICDSYFGGNLHGILATEELHFGEGMHRKAFRSKVMQGLVPVFSPGHPCVLKVHNAITYGTKSKDDLVQKNYKLALQECYVQNTAREYAKIYAAEAEPLEGFGEAPEIIPIFLVHRPANNIPYATVEEELIGEFVKYSVKDGKEINFLRRDSEAGQKCCTFQHWVYEKTNGNLLVTDLQDTKALKATARFPSLSSSEPSTSAISTVRCWV
ncbi:alpha-protein kinase 2 isoform X2 [Lagopus muta]|uniref:alpha-protein kinase 2 isoform X2 n=1 Tax=Lagopus muta TaxID=64668 RepID=UPI00209ECB0F|nr:alpha-protein kinase 2 isoform X2 [Lagopus muta]